MNYSKLKPGYQLDAIVAWRIFGEEMPKYNFPDSYAINKCIVGDPIVSDKGCWQLLCKYEEGDIPTWYPYPYSTDKEYAWRVVEKVGGDAVIYRRELLSGNGIYGVALNVVLKYDTNQSLESDFDKNIVWEDTLPYAICLAALQTINK